MVLDMYPKGPITAQTCARRAEPVRYRLNWFDAGNYMIERNWTYGNLWIQGGPRARKFFADTPSARRR
jgi:hypothetical protein